MNTYLSIYPSISLSLTLYIYIDTYIRRAERAAGALGEHKPGHIKPGRIKRAALSLQNQNYILNN